MKYYILLFIFLITACAASTPLPTATPIPTPTKRPIIFADPNFISQGEDSTIPIVTRNPSPEIRNLYINPGAVIFHEDKFHMFFNSFTAWPGLVKVGYMTSDDGYHWQMVQDEPVLTTDQIPFGDGNADVSSVLVMDDGTWVMYFHTVGSGEIGRATAASPIGPWVVDADPVLGPGPQGAWDQLGLEWPSVISVIKDACSFRMYYSAQTKDGYAISFATSTDGITWTKYNYNDPQQLMNNLQKVTLYLSIA